MSFVTAIYLTAMILSFVLVLLTVWAAVRSYLRLRDKIFVTCSSATACTAVEQDVSRVARSGD
ncbi:MAG: hypothetical protein HYV04_01800 [Deltaproteobacteria bacterium]|nr:hypothetical protein [Deltaproteobacteria bacterium]